MKWGPSTKSSKSASEMIAVMCLRHWCFYIWPGTWRCSTSPWRRTTSPLNGHGCSSQSRSWKYSGKMTWKSPKVWLSWSSSSTFEKRVSMIKFLSSRIQSNTWNNCLRIWKRPPVQWEAGWSMLQNCLSEKCYLKIGTQSWRQFRKPDLLCESFWSRPRLGAPVSIWWRPLTPS